MVPQDVVPEMFPQSLEGPALKIRDHLLKWEGAPKPHVQTSQTRSEPVEFRLMFESGVEEEVTSCLPMENCGTTAIYYSWKVYTPVVDLGFWKGGFRCPECFRLRSRRMCAQNDKKIAYFLRTSGPILPEIATTCTVYTDPGGFLGFCGTPV